MKITAICSTWNGATWLPYTLSWAANFFDQVLVQEVNWTTDDPAWVGKKTRSGSRETSPDGTADLVREFQSRHANIEFYQLGRFQHGCLAAREELCSRVQPTDWLYVLDQDEFQMDATLGWIRENLTPLQRQGYTSLSQQVRSFYWDFHQHTVEEFTRLYRWYPGLNAWFPGHPYARDFHLAREFKEQEPSPTEPGHTLFHYSYVPVPGVAIKGCQSFDVTEERYKSWYREVFRQYQGDAASVAEIYAQNGGGVHVFGGYPVHPYTGPHPEALADHPLRHARWRDGAYHHNETDALIPLEGWWNPHA